MYLFHNHNNNNNKYCHNYIGHENPRLHEALSHLKSLGLWYQSTWHPSVPGRDGCILTLRLSHRYETLRATAVTAPWLAHVCPEQMCMSHTHSIPNSFRAIAATLRDKQTPTSEWACCRRIKIEPTAHRVPHRHWGVPPHISYLRTGRQQLWPSLQKEPRLFLLASPGPEFLGFDGQRSWGNVLFSFSVGWRSAFETHLILSFRPASQSGYLGAVCLSPSMTSDN